MAAAMTIAFAVGFTGCGSSDDEAVTEASETTEAVSETAEEAGNEDGNTDSQLADLAGDWQDTVSQRATMTIKPAADGKTADVVVMWSESASECEQWKMVVRQEGSKLVYDTCEKSELEFDSNGNVADQESETEEGGYFELGPSGELNWALAADVDCTNCSFEMMTE